MTSHLTMLALDIARERAAEARNERIAADARARFRARSKSRPGPMARLRLALSALAGDIPEAASETPRSISATH
jgi:hypothetical protein